MIVTTLFKNSVWDVKYSEKEQCAIFLSKKRDVIEVIEVKNAFDLLVLASTKRVPYYIRNKVYAELKKTFREIKPANIKEILGIQTNLTTHLLQTIN